ncbi:unnamed protein product, partial [marine sediment metagenome]
NIPWFPHIPGLKCNMKAIIISRENEPGLVNLKTRKTGSPEMDGFLLI